MPSNRFVFSVAILASHVGVVVVDAAMATMDFLPPILPKEYSLNFQENYVAYYFGTDDIFTQQRTVGAQYWSLANLAQRAMVSSSVGGIGNGGHAGRPVNHFTVTNFTDPEWDRGSLVADLITQQCDYYRNEGGSSYQGYDFFQNFLASAISAGLPVEQYNVSDFVHGGVSYGPVNVWGGTPPTGIEGRVLTYTVVYPQDSNHLLLYQVNGTEHLNDEVTGEATYVTMRSVNIRTDYVETDVDSWVDGFFDVIKACPYQTTTTTISQEESETGSHNGTTTTTEIVGCEMINKVGSSSAVSFERFFSPMLMGTLFASAVCSFFFFQE